MEEYRKELKENKPKLIVWAVPKDADENKEENLEKQMMKQFLAENHYEMVQEGDVPIYAIKGELPNERTDEEI